MATSKALALKNEPVTVPSKQAIGSDWWENLDRKFASAAAARLPPPPRAIGEKRISTRANVRLPVSVKFDDVHQARGQTEDLSAHGIFLVVAQRLLYGCNFELVFRLPRKVIGPRRVWLRCQAEIVRVENRPHGKFGVAAAFRSCEVFHA